MPNKTKNLFVKFAPLNVYTISNLINKTIKFSNIYELDDLNEDNLLLGNRCLINALGKYPKEDFEKLITTENLNQAIKSDTTFKQLFKNKVTKTIKNKSILETFDNLQKDIKNSSPSSFRKEIEINESQKNQLNIINFIFTTISHIKTKFFCLSHIDIFNNDSTQIMFSHYGDKLNGLALIYHYEGDNIKKITYKNEYKNNIDIDLKKALDGKNHEKYLTKSEGWKYQQEYRIFENYKKENDICKASEYELELKAVFYTGKLDQNNINMIKEINKQI
jgi:hypothetical protein